MTHNLAASRLLVQLTAAWALVAMSAGSASLPVWQIGVDDDPFASGYDATHEFSQENYINDPRPGKVTRLPGDPLYNRPVTLPYKARHEVLWRRDDIYDLIGRVKAAHASLPRPPEVGRSISLENKRRVTAP